MQKEPSKRFWTLPNFITLLRLIFGAPVTIWLYANQYEWAWLIFLFFVATDWLDGLLARWMNSESSWGMFLDPVADQTLNLPIIWYFVWVPVWASGVPILLTVREIIMLILRYSAKRDIPSIYTGKIKVVLEYAGITAVLCDAYWQYAFWFFIWAILIAYVSLIQYAVGVWRHADHRA